MSITRDNHYLPQWYQRGFFEPGRNTFAYLDLSPEQATLANGKVVTHRALFDWPTAKCFRQRDLYSTFFLTDVNDEIERKLFGQIDSRGADAVRAYVANDVNGWIENFEAFFSYIDAQKLRTPKGLAWLAAQYPSLRHNELLMEMQGVRSLHCSIWAGGVREIVSAEDSDVKFIVPDHPVTIYNHAVAPGHSMCQGANEPSIALKASQTIFPINRDMCLILTNLEYAKDPRVVPLEKRTFPRNFQNGLVKADALIRERKLSSIEVSQINFVLKKRARRYIAAGKAEWLAPEKIPGVGWKEAQATLLPPQDSLWSFGGEIYASYTDGRTHYQDEYGRTEKPWAFLQKKVEERTIRPGSPCGCGSGTRYRDCCKSRETTLRPTWSERSIRERNLFLLNVISKELGLECGRDWTEIRASLTDEQIKRIYTVFAALWPLETDLLQLLPKPDGRMRAVYTGCIHPSAISEFAFGASLFFGEVLIEHPFLNARSMNKKYSPIEHPGAYRQEFLKSVLMFLMVMPLVEAGRVNLYPDPCVFDTNIQRQVHFMAQDRMRHVKIDPSREPRMRALIEEDGKRGIMAMPKDILRNILQRSEPGADAQRVEALLGDIELVKRADPLATLQDGDFDGSADIGSMYLAKLAPNFEVAMYLAQATGSVLITDSLHRWDEIRRAILLRSRRPSQTLKHLGETIERSTFSLPVEPSAILDLYETGVSRDCIDALQAAMRYASRVEKTGAKPNLERAILSRFRRAHATAHGAISKSGAEITLTRMACAFPEGGIQDNTINRLLLMSSSEHHLPSVPMAFYLSSVPS